MNAKELTDALTNLAKPLTTREVRLHTLITWIDWPRRVAAGVVDA